MPYLSLPTVYRGRRFRSETEAHWAAFFDLLGIHWEYEAVKGYFYLPDFRIILKDGQTVFVEVKGAQGTAELRRHGSHIHSGMTAWDVRQVLTVGSNWRTKITDECCPRASTHGWTSAISYAAPGTCDCWRWMIYDDAAMLGQTGISWPRSSLQFTLWPHCWKPDPGMYPVKVETMKSLWKQAGIKMRNESQIETLPVESQTWVSDYVIEERRKDVN